MVLLFVTSLPFLSNAASNSAVVHCQTVLMVVDTTGSIRVMLFALAGITVGLVGRMLLATIHVVVKTFLTALFVLSINLLDLLELDFDSSDSIELEFLVMGIFYM
jgi:hypothetical protein